MSTVLAADIGGTNIRAAIVAADGSIAQELHASIPLGERDISEAVLIAKLSAFFSEMIEKAPAISAIGIGFPGFFRGDSGVLVSSPNLVRLANVNLAEKLSAELNIPVYVQNDALCAAIGEHRFGAAVGATNLLHITLGTGIGGGLILGNTPYTGESGMAMEFGHLRVAHDPHARLCGCGGRGCVEAYASATAVAARYFEASGTQTTAEDVYTRGCGGDSDAKTVIESAGAFLGMAMAEAVKLLDLHTVTISGGLTGAWPLLYPSMMASLNDNLIPPLKGKINILNSTLHDRAGLLGAASLKPECTHHQSLIADHTGRI